MQRAHIFMFSGQGSQYFHMGKELFDSDVSFQKWMLKLDDMISKHLGESVLAKMYDKNVGKGDLFARTLYTHPAIFMIEYALAQALIEHGIKPDFVLGSSLGEYTAATLSEVIDLEIAIEALIKQARLLESLGTKGSMLAILGNASLYHENPIMHQKTELAGVNFDGHFVIAGENDALDEIILFLKKKEIMFQKLPVSQGFHSKIIDPLAWDYLSYLNTLSFNNPQIPFISGARAKIISDFSPDYFWEVIRNPMLFQETINFTEKNIDASERIYIDLGPSGTLATFIKYILGKETSSVTFSILTPFAQDVNNFKKIVDYFL